MNSNVSSGEYRMEPFASNDMLVRRRCEHYEKMPFTQGMWVEHILTLQSGLCPACLLRNHARKAAKSLIRPYVLNSRHRWTLKNLQENLTESGPAYHASIGRSAFWKGEREGDAPFTDPLLLELPLTKIGVYRVGEVPCSEVFDLADIYRDVCDEEKAVTQVALF